MPVIKKEEWMKFVPIKSKNSQRKKLLRRPLNLKKKLVNNTIK